MASIGTKSAIGGAARGLTSGLVTGFGLAQDVQARRLAERRAQQQAEMEQERMGLARTASEREGESFAESKIDLGRKRLQEMAEASIGPDFSQKPKAEQAVIFQKLLTSIQTPETDPSESTRNVFLVRNVMEEVERAKREARDLEQQKLDSQRHPPEAGKDGVAATTKATLFKLGQAEAAIKSLEEFWKKTEPSEGGVEAKLKGTAQRVGATVGAAPNTQIYQDISGGLLAMIAKSFGESGVLTDADIKRSQRLAPRVGDSAQVAETKLRNLMDVVEHGKKNALIIEGGGMPAPYEWGDSGTSESTPTTDPLGLR